MRSCTDEIVRVYEDAYRSENPIFENIFLPLVSDPDLVGSGDGESEEPQFYPNVSYPMTATFSVSCSA